MLHMSYVQFLQSCFPVEFQMIQALHGNCSDLVSVCIYAEETGSTSAQAVCPAAIALIGRIDKLYDKPMPASTNWF